MVKMSTATLSVVFVLFCCCNLSDGFKLGPLHASCKIEWEFPAKWSDVKGRIVNQIKAWNGADNCKNGGEKCLYSLTSETDNEIQAVHETPKKHYKDDLTFTLVADGDSSCKVKGYSTSETWYALLDQGTNYCNLENLIVGAGLNQGAGYKETTSSSVCTQYGSQNCDVY